jgi:hypothetical protein
MTSKKSNTKRRSNREKKRYWEMTSNELASATKEFDREFIADTFGPPPAKAQQQLKRARRRGRPRVGKGARRVLITVERTLLAQADAYAKSRGLNRSQLVARGLKYAMAPKAA